MRPERAPNLKTSCNLAGYCEYCGAKKAQPLPNCPSASTYRASSADTENSQNGLAQAHGLLLSTRQPRRHEERPRLRQQQRPLAQTRQPSRASRECRRDSRRRPRFRPPPLTSFPTDRARRQRASLHCSYNRPLSQEDSQPHLDRSRQHHLRLHRLHLRTSRGRDCHRQFCWAGLLLAILALP